MAAPFGTTEFMLNGYGVEDVDFTFDDAGAPVYTDRGRSEVSTTGAGWHLISAPTLPLFSAHQSQEFATVSHAAQLAIIGAMLPDPTVGLYSPTAAAESTLARDTFLSGVSDIVLSRRPIGDLTNLIADWRNRAGDRMRAQFQTALEKA